MISDRFKSIALVKQSEELSVLPSTSVVLGVQLAGRVNSEDGPLAPAGVTGMQTIARRYTYAGATASILVRFTPEGAACLGVPASELSRRSIPLDALFPRSKVEELLDRLYEGTGEREQLALVAKFLTDLPYRRDPSITHALAMIETTSVRAIARALSISERQLERRFLERIGLTPKQYASLARFERAVALARETPSLTEAALAAGYYDQAHFNRDFRRFAGAPPKAVLAR